MSLARFIGNRPSDRVMAQGMLGLSLAANISPEGFRRRAMVRFVNNRLEGTQLSEWASIELARNDPAALLRAGAALGGFDSRGWLATIDVPTAVVVTEEDHLVPPANQRAMADAIPGAEVFTVNGDHAACVSDAARFVPALIRACQSVVGRGAGRPVTT